MWTSVDGDGRADGGRPLRQQSLAITGFHRVVKKCLTTALERNPRNLSGAMAINGFL